MAAAQARLAERYERLELLAGRLAELSQSSQPNRARLLRNLVSQGREQQVPDRFDSLLAELERGSLGDAVRGQAGLTADLEKLLTLLLEDDRGKAIDEQRKEIRRQLAELKRIVRLQRGILGGTEGGADPQQLEEGQRSAAEQTGRLAAESSQQSSGSEGQSDSSSGEGSSGGESGDESSEGSSGGEQSGGSQGSSGEPSPPQAAESLRKAEERMQQAAERLAEAKRNDSAEQQREALAHLAEARAQLEKILRQLREEELLQTLARLESRLKNMLDRQIAVLKRTEVLDQASGKTPRHELEIASARLARRQQSIGDDADRTLLLLREDGTSVAFPEALSIAREDMAEAAVRLRSVKLGEVTQSIEADIIESLEEALAAVKTAKAELEEKQKSGQPSSGQGGPGEQELVNQLAELKMIRGLQSRVNRRTVRYAKMLESGASDADDLIEGLRRLSEREQRIFEATRDLHQGSNR